MICRVRNMSRSMSKVKSGGFYYEPCRYNVERVERVGILAAKMFGDGIESKNLLAKSTCSTRFHKYE